MSRPARAPAGKSILSLPPVPRQDPTTTPNQGLPIRQFFQSWFFLSRPQISAAIDKFFEYILKLTNQTDRVLAEIDQLLEDEELYQLIRKDLAKRFPLTGQTGRNSNLVKVVLRMLAVKRLYALSYEQTEYQVRDSLVFRKFCRVYI